MSGIADRIAALSADAARGHVPEPAPEAAYEGGLNARTSNGLPINVNPAILGHASQELLQGAVAIETLLNDLERGISPLGNEWRGSASASFEALWGQWQEGAEHVRQALVAIAELLSKAGAAYEEADQSIAAAFEL